MSIASCSLFFYERDFDDVNGDLVDGRFGSLDFSCSFQLEFVHMPSKVIAGLMQHKRMHANHRTRP